MFPKRKPMVIQCYRDNTGEKLGEKTRFEWSEELGIKTGAIDNAKSKGYAAIGRDGKKYRFYNIGDIPPKLPLVTLADVDAVCKAEGKAYGRLQTEILNGRTITPEEAEEARRKIKGEKPAESTETEEKEKAMEEHAETMKPAENATEGPAECRVSLAMFAGMADDITLAVYYGDDWIFTAPSKSSIFKTMNWNVDKFQLAWADESFLKVWVK